MRGARGAPHCTAGNAQQNRLRSTPPSGLMGNVHPARVPSARRTHSSLGHLLAAPSPPDGHSRCYRSSWPASSWHMLSPLATLLLSREQARFSTWEAVGSDPAGLRRLQLCSEGSQRLSPHKFQKYFNGETTALWLKPKFCIVLTLFFPPLPFCRMVEYSLDLQNINLSAIRTVRVLRPLKAINRVPSKSWFPLMPTLLGSWGVHGQ